MQNFSEFYSHLECLYFTQKLFYDNRGELFSMQSDFFCIWLLRGCYRRLWLNIFLRVRIFWTKCLAKGLNKLLNNFLLQEKWKRGPMKRLEEKNSNFWNLNFFKKIFLKYFFLFSKLFSWNKWRNHNLLLWYTFLSEKYSYFDVNTIFRFLAPFFSSIFESISAFFYEQLFISLILQL